MFEYSFCQWLMFFYIYCFVGWCIESTIVSVERKRFINRGFLRSPMLPIYGFGALVILFVTLPVRGHPMLVYIFGMLGTTLLEYFTGYIMETTLKMKYWDYSDQKYNLNGRICVQSSLFWGVLSLFLTDFLHKWVEKLVLSISGVMTIILLCGISAVFICDLVYAVRTALDVNKMLGKMDELRLQIALAKAELSDRLEENETNRAIIARLDKLRAERARLTDKLGFFKKDFIAAHPTAKSIKFNETLSELRERIYRRKK